MARKISTTFTQYKQQVSQEELDLLQEKMKADPGNLDLLDWAAFAFYSHGHVDTAIDLYSKLLDAYPDNASYHYYLANTLYKKGDQPGAEEHWNRVLNLDSEGGFSERARRKLTNLKR